MPVRKAGSRWLVDIRYRGERFRIRSPGVTKADAQAHETYLRGELAQHGSLVHLDASPAQATVPTFAQFAERWMATYVAANNKPSEVASKTQILRCALLPCFAGMPLDTIGRAEVEAFKAGQVARGLSPKTVNNRLAVLRCALNHAADDGLLEQVPPIRQLRCAPPAIQFLRLSEVRRIADEMRDPPWPTVVRLAASTGLRFGELAGLEWRDLQLDAKVPMLTVARALVRGRLVTPKSGRVRHVPLPNWIASELALMPRIGAPVFLSRGGRLGYCAARNRLRAACARAQVSSIGWHVLRHSYVSELVERGASPRAVQALAGHSTLAMTERYMHLRPDALHRAVRLLDENEPRAPGGHANETSAEIALASWGGQRGSNP